LIVTLGTMTDHTLAATQPTRHPNPTDDRRLRLVLRSNALTSGFGGLVAVAAPARLDEVLGTGHPGWVRIVGAGLVAFAGIVALVSRASTPLVVRLAPMISVADASWVVGTILTIAAGWYSNAGAVLMASVAAMVGGFSIAQATIANRLAG
jgi:hypothetical protein